MSSQVTAILLLAEATAGYWFLSVYYRPRPLVTRLLLMASIAIGSALLLGGVTELLTGNHDPWWDTLAFIAGGVIRVLRQMLLDFRYRKGQEILSAEAAGNNETL